MTEDQQKIAVMLLYQASNEITTCDSIAKGSYYFGNEVADRIYAFLLSLDKKEASNG